ncbi:hypothetical protein FQR65_LT04124 [Abscondita terminalis]|nr:hypothetical protein FQR65_LT04124 [Abscondita terminalis]
MALVKKAVVLNLFSKKQPLLFTVIRNHWNKDYKPGHVPRTEEEINLAAKKYGLLPSEYDTFKDDGLGYGDYPKIPTVSADARDPFYPWDIPDTKRNFKEIINAEEDMYAEHRYDITTRHRVPGYMQLFQFLGFLGLTFGIYAFCENMKWFHAVAAKQYPKPGEIHYTFEIEN